MTITNSNNATTITATLGTRNTTTDTNTTNTWGDTMMSDSIDTDTIFDVAHVTNDTAAATRMMVGTITDSTTTAGMERATRCVHSGTRTHGRMLIVAVRQRCPPPHRDDGLPDCC